MSLKFVDIVFFVKTCESGIDEAKRELSITTSEVPAIIQSIQDFIGGNLFVENNTMSLQNLTEIGKIFFRNAQRMTSELMENLSQTADLTENGKAIIKIKSDIISGKNIVLPSITELEQKTKEQEINIELFTLEDHNRLKNLDMHVVFHRTERADRLLFTKRWTLKIEQALYASSKYLEESRNVPKTITDLQRHAILGLGDSFAKDVYSYTNWHLSEKYLGIQLTPAIMFNSRSVLIAAIKAHLGIGPIDKYKRDMEDLIQILPDIKGPPVLIDFAVKKNLDKKYQDCIDQLEQKLLQKINRENLTVIY